MENKDSAELTWQEYEGLTKYIYEMLGSKYGIKVKGYGKDCKVTGKSTVKHQVDVLTEQLGQDKPNLCAIECKFLKSKVTKDTVMKLHSIMADCDIASGIIVSKMGFTRDTLTYAEHLGIKLVELREFDDDNNQDAKDVTLADIFIHSNILIKRPVIVSIDLGSVQITEEREIMAMHIQHYAMIHTPEGRTIPFNKYLREFCEQLHKNKIFLKTTNVNYQPVHGKLVRMHDSQQYEIEKISFSGFLCEIDASSKRSFQLVDQVWMIMKEIFEKTSYKLTKSGIIFIEEEK